MCDTHNARPCPCGGASRSHPCYSSRSPPCRCIPSIRHVSDVWLCSEWIVPQVPHTEKHPCIFAKNLFKLSVEKVKISTFSEYCNLHSKHCQTPLTCLPWTLGQSSSPSLPPAAAASCARGPGGWTRWRRPGGRSAWGISGSRRLWCRTVRGYFWT